MATKRLNEVMEADEVVGFVPLEARLCEQGNESNIHGIRSLLPRRMEKREFAFATHAFSIGSKNGDGSIFQHSLFAIAKPRFTRY